MVILLSLLTILLAVIDIPISYAARSLPSGACFQHRLLTGCSGFKGFMTRKQCCRHTGFFVRQPDSGQLFLAAMLNAHQLPNCEIPCGPDYCKDRRCGVGHRCIMRDHDSICTSDCQCTPEQRLSGPVCVLNGPKYRSMCDLHLESCWGNTTPTLVPCSSTGCDTAPCGSKRCLLNLKGRSECVDGEGDCTNSINNPVCGVDNSTYSSQCDIRRAGILRGREIHVAYKGPCRSSARCSNVVCPESDMSCVKHYKNESPVCVKCPRSMLDCNRADFESDQLVCLSIQRQSSNICYKDFLSCQNDVFIEIIHSGLCFKVAKFTRHNV